MGLPILNRAVSCEAWQLFPQYPELGGDDVAVVIASLDRCPRDLLGSDGLLSPDERERASRFYFDRDRQHFIAGRSYLRMLLGRYLQRPPESLSFTYSQYGKPKLARLLNNPSLEFNLSHSGGTALYAFARNYRVGVDLELIRPLDNLERMIQNCFARSEQEAFSVLSPAGQQLAFFRAWTAKEAYLKGTGDGLMRPLNQIEVSILPDRPIRLLRLTDTRKELSRWSVMGLNIVTGDSKDFAVAALAVEGVDWKLKLWRLEL